MNNYNKIAKYYDTLAKLVFGNSLINAQKNQLTFIPPNSHVLIVGGGTGWILEEIAKLRCDGLIIDYLEASLKMVDLAKKRDIKRNIVNFLCARIENFKELDKYDVVITPFVFDNFEEEQIASNFLIVDRCLKAGGYWLFSDFYVKKTKYITWKNVLLKTMYLFFRIMASVQTKRLVDLSPVFDKYNYSLILEKWYYRKMIRAAVYQK